MGDLDRWIDRASWCGRHRQMLYVTADDWAFIAVAWNEQMDRRPRIDRYEPGSRLLGVEIVLDPRKAERQARLHASGVRVIPCRGGPLDGEVEGEHLDVAALNVAGADGKYIPVSADGLRIGWLWNPVVHRG